jgi:Spy/CpxP family protein refolding chaperone
MRRLVTLFTVVAALAAAFVGLAMAADPAPRGLGRLQQQLGLSDDQVKAIQEIHARHAQAQRQLWQQIRTTRREVRDLAVKGGDPGTLDAKTQELAQLFAQALKLRVQTLQEISPVLTPDQREKYAQMGPGYFRHQRGPRPNPQSQPNPQS